MPKSTKKSYPDYKVQYNRAKRAAERQNITLRRERRRDTRAYDYGWYHLEALRGRDVVALRFDSLDEVEAHLKQDPPPARRRL